MTYFINLRGGNYGAVVTPYVLTGNALVGQPAMSSVPYESIPALVKNKNVLLVTHGFNVNYIDGLRSLACLEAWMKPTSGEFVFGVLWPGDWVIPAINYPFAESIATQAGKLLGTFCKTWLAGAKSLSFASHSLGARVVLQAVSALPNARNVCIMAGAIGDDCLVEEYQTAAIKCEKITTLSSMEDMVLAAAYPPGDLIADILDVDHTPFAQALGRNGPEEKLALPSAAIEIPDTSDYGHGDYLPPSDPQEQAATSDAKWPPVATFIAHDFRDQAQDWP